MNFKFGISIILAACFFLSFTSYADTFGVTHTNPFGFTPAPAIQPVSVPTMVPVVRSATPPAPSLSNATMVGKVVWIKGTFKAISSDSRTRTLIKADPIYLHDTLTTDSSTEAQIVFTDDTLMTFRPSSNFYINTYSYNANAPKGASAGHYIMNLLEGGFRTITGLIAKANPSDYRVNTPVATIGVRGTDYAIYLKEGQLFVGYYQGSPCVSNKNQTLCLDQKTPYAHVPSANAVPVPLTQQPPELGTKQTITNVTFTSMITPPGTGGPTSPIGPANPNNPISPNGTNINNIMNSFCIQ